MFSLEWQILLEKESHLTFPLKGKSFLKKDERFLLGFVASSGGGEHPKLCYNFVPPFELIFGGFER